MNKTIEERLAAIEAKLGTTQTTRVLVIQDRSGSMEDRITETISGYNEYVKTLKDDDSDEAFLTLVQFDDRYEVKEDNTPVSKVEDLSESTYVPRGMTALLDAVGRGVTTLKDKLGKNERALVVIMTDGIENYSKEWTRTKVTELIRSCEDIGRWTFVFLGAGQDAWQGGDLLGLRRAQTVHYGEDAHSHGIAYASLGTMTSQLRGGVAPAMANSGTVASLDMAEKGGTVNLETSDSEEVPAGAGG